MQQPPLQVPLFLQTAFFAAITALPQRPRRHPPLPQCAKTGIIHDTANKTNIYLMNFMRVPPLMSATTTIQHFLLHNETKTILKKYTLNFSVVKCPTRNISHQP